MLALWIVGIIALLAFGGALIGTGAGALVAILVLGGMAILANL